MRVAIQPDRLDGFLAHLHYSTVLAASAALVAVVFLGAISVTLNTLADLLVVAFAAPLARTLTGTWRRRQQLATGPGMITLGIYVAAD